MKQNLERRAESNFIRLLPSKRKQPAAPREQKSAARFEDLEYAIIISYLDLTDFFNQKAIRGLRKGVYPLRRFDGYSLEIRQNGKKTVFTLMGHYGVGIAYHYLHQKESGFLDRNDGVPEISTAVQAFTIMGAMARGYTLSLRGMRENDFWEINGQVVDMARKGLLTEKPKPFY